MILNLALYAVIIPCGAEGIVLFAAWFLRRGSSSEKPLIWAGALGVALAYAAGHAGLYQEVPTLNDAGHWCFFLALACGVFGILEGIFSNARWLWALVRALAAFAALWLVFAPQRKNVWQPAEAWLWMGGLSAALAAQWISWDALSRRISDRTSAILMAITLSGCSGVLALSGAAKFGMLCGVLIAATSMIVAVSLVFPKLQFARGSFWISVPVNFLLLAQGLIRALPPMPWSCAILLFAAPFCAWLAELAAVKKWSPLKIWLIRIAAVGIPIAAALAIALANSAGAQSGGEEE